MKLNSRENNVSIIYELDNACDFELSQNLECIESLFESIEFYIKKFNATVQLLVVSEENLALSTLEHIEYFQEKQLGRLQFKVELLPESTYFEKKFHGITKCCFENVLLADSDCFYKSNWIELLIYELQSDSQLVWGKTFAYKDNRKLANLMRYIWQFPINENDPLNAAIIHRWGNNFGLKKNLLTQYPFEGSSHFGKNTRGDLTQWVNQIAQNEPIFKIMNALAYHRQPESINHFSLRMYQAGKDFGHLTFDATINYPRYFLTLYLMNLSQLPETQKISFKLMRLAYFKNELSILNLAKAVFLIYLGAASYYCGVVISRLSMVENLISQTTHQ